MHLNLAFLFLAVAGGTPTDGVPPLKPDDPSLKQFAQRLLALIQDPREKNFRAVAAVGRIREDARDFVKRLGSREPFDDARLVEEWLETLKPVCDDSWETCDVVRIDAARGGPKARIRLKSADGAQADCLVKLVADGAEQRLVDLQRLPNGMSAAAVTSLALAGAAPEEAADEFRQLEAGASSDPRRVFWNRKEFQKRELSSFGDRVCLAWAATAHRPLEALRRAETLSRSSADDPAVAWLTAKAHFELEHYREAVRSLEAYESLVGADVWSRLLRAKSHRKQGSFADARRECAAALKDDPTSDEAALELFEVTPPRSKAEAAALLPTDAGFESMAWTLGAALESSGDAPGLQALLNHAEKNQAGDDVVAYLRGEHLLAVGNPAEAADAVAKHLPEGDDESEDADNILDLYCEAMHRTGRAKEAYQKAATPKKAFAALIDKLDADKDAALYRALGAEHVKRVPADGAGLEHYALFLFKQKKFADAARLIDAYLSRAGNDDADNHDTLRTLRVRLFLGEKKLPETLKFIDDDEDLFGAAAKQLADDSRLDDLAKLIDGYAEKADDPAPVANWRAELAFLQKNYSLAIALFHVLAAPSPDSPGVDIDNRRSLLLLRTMIRLHLNSGIEQLAQRIVAPDNELGFVFAYAASGDAAKLEQALEDCLEAGTDVQEILSDPDLAPLLDQPALAKIRDKVLLDRELNP